jgi:hypothetical protein
VRWVGRGGAAIHVSGGLTRQQALDVDGTEALAGLLDHGALPADHPLTLEMDHLHAALMTLPLADVLGIDDKFLPSYLRAAKPHAGDDERVSAAPSTATVSSTTTTTTTATTSTSTSTAAPAARATADVAAASAATAPTPPAPVAATAADDFLDELLASDAPPPPPVAAVAAMPPVPAAATAQDDWLDQLLG